MCDEMTIGSWVTLRGRCAMGHTVNDGDSVEFSFSDGSKTLELTFDVQALEGFVRHGVDALREMERMRAGGPVTPR